MKINKKLVLCIISLIWLVFSIGYIAWDLWGDFKAGQMSAAYQNGYAQAIINVAEEANKCASTGVPLNLGNDSEGQPITVTIVGVSCLQPAQENSQEEAKQ